MRSAAVVAGLALGLMSGAAQAAQVYTDTTLFLKGSYIKSKNGTNETRDFDANIKFNKGGTITPTIDLDFDAGSVNNRVDHSYYSGKLSNLNVVFGNVESNGHSLATFELSFETNLISTNNIILPVPTCKCGIQSSPYDDIDYHLGFDLVLTSPRSLPDDLLELSKPTPIDEKSGLSYNTIFGLLKVSDETVNAQSRIDNPSHPKLAQYITPLKDLTFVDFENVYRTDLGVVSPVPLPSSAPMFGAALLALGAAGYGLKRKKTSAAA